MHVLFLSLCCCLILLGGFSPAHAARLRPYAMTPAQQAAPAEDTWNTLQARLHSIIAIMPIGDIQAYRMRPQRRLPSAQRKAVAEYAVIEDDLAFWKSVVGLKQALLQLPPANPSPAVMGEADALSKQIIQTLYDLSPRYNILGSPLMHNAAIKMGLRKRGYCYHYTNDLRAVLKTTRWQEFEISWAEANAGQHDESNALAIRRRGQPFDSGLVVDGWRYGGRPYWHSVRNDAWPWVEAPNMEIEDD